MSDRTDVERIDRRRLRPRRFFELAQSVGHGRALGLAFRDAGDDWIELALPWREELVGVPESGILASGAIVSLLDTCGGASVWLALARFQPLVTIDLRLDYLSPCLEGRDGHRPLPLRQIDSPDRVRQRDRAYRRPGSAHRACDRHLHAQSLSASRRSKPLRRTS